MVSLQKGEQDIHSDVLEENIMWSVCFGLLENLGVFLCVYSHQNILAP